MSIDRREIKSDLVALRRVKTWQLVFLFFLALFVSAVFLRLDNVGMVERREAVKAADAAGDNEEIRDRLYDLQAYAASHMNAGTGEVFLTQKYERDGQAIAQKVQKAAEAGGTASSKADKICRPRYQKDGFWSQAYLECIRQESQKIAAANDPIAEIEAPDPSLYRYEFYSPLWAFGFSGISLLVTVMIGLIILVRMIIIIVLKVMLKRQYRHA